VLLAAGGEVLATGERQFHRDVGDRRVVVQQFLLRQVQAPVLTCHYHAPLLSASGAEFKAIGVVYEEIYWTNPNAISMNG